MPGNTYIRFMTLPKPMSWNRDQARAGKIGGDLVLAAATAEDFVSLCHDRPLQVGPGLATPTTEHNLPLQDQLHPIEFPQFRHL